MKNLLSYFTPLVTTVSLATIFFCAPFAKATLPTSVQVIAKMRLADDYWIAGHPTGGDYAWRSAAFQIGNLACFDTTQNLAYYNHSLAWAQSLNWRLRNGMAVSNASWSADDFAAGQPMLRLDQLKPAYTKTLDTKRVADELVAIVPPAYLSEWWWIDSLHMSMPNFLGLMSKYPASAAAYNGLMFNIYSFLKAGRIQSSNTILYDQPAVSPYHLWFRDGSHSLPHFTPNGLKEFWSRGNAWAFISLAKALRDLPTTDAHYIDYLGVFIDMAAALKIQQRADGFWNESLIDPSHFGGPETSGTAGLTYGFALGINIGALSSATYLPVVDKAWNGIVNFALNPTTGKLGYVQAEGGAPGDPVSSGNPNNLHPLTANSEQDYGVGLFLLAGSEVVKLAPGYVTPTAATIPNAPNLAAVTGTLITFSSQQAGNEATHAIDSNQGTRWSSSGATYPQWIRINLGSVKSVSRVKLFPFSSRPYQYKIETSVDGTTYASPISASPIVGAAFYEEVFAARDAKFIKLTILGAYTGAGGYTGGWSSINEVEVYPW